MTHSRRFAAITLILNPDKSLELDVDCYDEQSEPVVIPDAEMIKHISSVLLYFHKKVADEYRDLTGNDYPSGEEVQSYIDFLNKNQL